MLYNIILNIYLILNISLYIYIDMSIPDILPPPAPRDLPVHLGGPVEANI